MASILKKAKEASQKLRSNVFSGISSAVSKVGGTSQTGAVLNATAIPGAITKALAPKPATTGVKIGDKTVYSLALPSVKLQEPFKGFGGGASGGTGTSSSFASVNNGSPSISTDGMALESGLSNSSFSSFSSPSGNSVSSPSAGLPSTSVVNTSNLGTSAGNQKLTFPEPTTTDYSKYIPAVAETDLEKTTKEKDTSLKDYFDTLLNDKPDSADAYAKAQRETEILKKQQTVNDLTGQLNAIVSKGQANQLALVGQGRGIPEAIIGGQQAQIGRETAIAALPVQAQLSAAQGNLEMANDNLDTLFKIYSDDAKNDYENKKEKFKMLYEIADAKEKRALEKLDKAEERTYQETQDLHTEQNAYAKMAFETGQSSLGAKIAKLDYKSPTFKQDLATFSSQIKDTKRELEIQKLQTDLVNARTTINPKVLTTTQFKAAQAAQNLKLTLEKAKTAAEKYGNNEMWSGTGAGILNSIKVQLRSEISTALEQGVVVPGEAAAFDSIAGEIQSGIFTRNTKTIAALDSLSKSMDGRIALQKSALTSTYKITPEQVDTLLNIIDLSDQEFIDMDALIE